MKTKPILRTAGITLLALAAMAALGLLLVRDQIHRRRRDLFSPHAVKRWAALGYLSRAPASVDSALLLRDFIAWERRPMLRRRAATLLARMEDGLDMDVRSGARPKLA